MTEPRRIQLRRTKGWRLPAGAVIVSRPSRWGNPFTVGAVGVQYGGASIGPSAGRYDPKDVRWCDQPLGDGKLTAVQAVVLYRYSLAGEIDDGDPYCDELRSALGSLRGHDLACWCPLDEPCHADVLLEIANGPPSRLE